MKTFWNLYRKELQALTWPGIAIALFMVICIVTIIANIDDFVPSNTIYGLSGQMVPGTIIRVISHTFNILFPALFLYSILNEHYTRSEFQLHILPAQRSLIFAAKIAAVVSWSLTILPGKLVLLFLNMEWMRFNTSIQFDSIYSGLTHMNVLEYVEFGVLHGSGFMIGLLSICALILLAHTVSASVKHYSFVAGIATFGAGFILHNIILRTTLVYALQKIPFNEYASILFDIQTWSNGISLIMAVGLFLIPALLLYERYAEI